MGSQPQNKTIFLATPEQLTCPHCYLHLFLTVKSLTHLSSAGIITAIEVLFRDGEYEGLNFRYPNGAAYEIPFIFDVFPDKKESGRRWVSDFRRSDATGIGPRRMSPCLARLQCIELLVQCSVSQYRRGTDTPRCSPTHVPLGW